MKKRILFFFFMVTAAAGIFSASRLEPFSRKIQTNVGSYNSRAHTKLPLIAWGADIVTSYANGNKVKTTSNSLFGQNGWSFELYREDNFQKQVEMYLKGETVWLRGTMGMINMAADVTEKDNRTKMVIVYQHSWSAGGDVLVVKQGINSIADLRGKTIAINSYGPHVAFFAKLLQDAGLSFNDVNIRWTKNLLGGDGDNPADALYDSNVHAAFVIIPDALILTNNGTVGTGGESVKGARILLSTKTANRIINDVYAVRKDYYDSHRSQIEKFVKAMLQAEEKVKDLMKNKNSSETKRMLAAAGGLLLDDSSDIDNTYALYFDAELAGYDGNVQFFSDSSYPRNFEKLNGEIQDSFIALGLLSSRKTLNKASLNYSSLASGLRYARQQTTTRFDKEEVNKVIVKKQSNDSLDKSALFSFDVFFKANQNTFPSSQYASDFKKLIDLSSTYGGALIVIEGHSDPMKYLRKKKAGASTVELNKIKQSAKNLSYSRANSLRDEIISYARSQGINLDIEQFAITGMGISKPRHAVPKTEQQWYANMRVEVKIISVEAEEDVFVPLD